MNPFARLIDPSEPVPQPHTLNGFVHILADEIDHTTMLPASKSGAKPPAMQGPVVGLPRYELQYERDESVCVVRMPQGSMFAELFLPVMVARTAPATATTENARRR